MAMIRASGARVLDLARAALDQVACTSASAGVDGCRRPLRVGVGARRPGRVRCRTAARTEDDPREQAVVVGAEPDGDEVGVLVDVRRAAAACSAVDAGLLQARQRRRWSAPLQLLSTRSMPGRVGDPVGVVDARC